MGIHTLDRTQIVPASLERCWAFFSNPHNLAKITPPELDFQVLTQLPEQMHPGLMIQYQVRPLFGVPMSWLTEITHVEPGRYFVDEQRVGPYAVWHHEHWFRAVDAERTEMRDLVHYVLPFQPFGDVVHPWLVQPQLEKIFDFRTRAVERLFGAGAGQA